MISLKDLVYFVNKNPSEGFGGKIIVLFCNRYINFNVCKWEATARMDATELIVSESTVLKMLWNVNLT